MKTVELRGLYDINFLCLQAFKPNKVNIEAHLQKNAQKNDNRINFSDDTNYNVFILFYFFFF